MVRIRQDDFQPDDDRDDSSRIITEDMIVRHYGRGIADAMLEYRRHCEDGGTRYWTREVAIDLFSLIDWGCGPP